MSHPASSETTVGLGPEAAITAAASVALRDEPRGGPGPAPRPASSPTLGEQTKRGLDLAVASIGLVLITPLLAVIAVAIKTTSPGSVFYRGVRTGRHGRPFRIIKFRTMVVDAERIGGSTTGKDDPRITAVGKVLRRYKLDELPQFINVLRGDMSLVGPRPEMAEYTDAYSPDERRILRVRPGITDLACLEFSNLQEVVGSDDPDGTFRARVLPRKNALRLKYVDERSLWLDLTILARTVLLVLTKPLRGRRHSWR